MKVCWTGVLALAGSTGFGTGCTTGFGASTTRLDGNPSNDEQEDLDLLSFSSLDDTFKSESSPLKGVYRETTFGLRYLYVPESSEARKVGRERVRSLASTLERKPRSIDGSKSRSRLRPLRCSSSTSSVSCVRARRPSLARWSRRRLRPLRVRRRVLLQSSSILPYRMLERLLQSQLALKS